MLTEAESHVTICSHQLLLNVGDIRGIECLLHDQFTMQLGSAFHLQLSEVLFWGSTWLALYY